MKLLAKLLANLMELFTVMHQYTVISAYSLLYRRYLHGNINKASVITTLPRLEHNQLLWYNHYYCNSKEKAYIKSSQCLIHMMGEV